MTFVCGQGHSKLVLSVRPSVRPSGCLSLWLAGCLFLSVSLSSVCLCISPLLSPRLCPIYCYIVSRGARWSKWTPRAIFGCPVVF